MPLDLALTDAGYNGRTGRYGFSTNPATGDVLLDSSQEYAVMTSCVCVKGAWWADSTHGSDLATLQSTTKLTPSPTPSQAEAMTLDALLPLERLNLIAPNPTAVGSLIPYLGISKLQVVATWQIPGGGKTSRTVTR
jgi:phage gp46-like protein